MTLQAYVLRRVLLLVPMIVGISLLTFVVSHMVPADPVSAMLTDKARPETVAAFREQWGLDRPLPEQYLRYLGGLLRLDFGVSIFSHHPVADDLALYLPATLELATTALLVTVFLGIPLGVLTAVYRESWLDRVVRVVSLLGASAPIFWLAIVGLLVFYSWLDWVPGPGRIDARIAAPQTITGLYTVDSLLTQNWDAFGSSVRHLILPALVLGGNQMVYLLRVTRSSVLEVLGQEYVRTAHAKGLGWWTVVYRHAVPNALIPTVAYLGLSYGSLLAGAVVTEIVFAWPGMGRYALQGTTRLDFPAIVGVTTVIAVIYVAVNLVVDVAQSFMDPRIRLGR
ncbi:MAG: ABC transporter permease [Chloroflexi bacterium]|nr:ABC transporter permease [Chloroflexota bacterium]